MNIICLGGRVTGIMAAWDYVQAFVFAKFTKEERHRRRLEKIKALEKRYGKST